jgi:phosphoribosylanthranilate isomerase
MLDAKPSAAEQAGGTGKVFDWELLEGAALPARWMLAGGLNAGNVREAIARLSPPAVDVSSGVEAMRGVKDPAAIKAFLAAVKNPR